MKNENKVKVKAIEYQIPLAKGPYQNNGASPWFAQLNMGTPGLLMKINFDTGARFAWLTSTQCTTTACNENSDGTPRTKFNPDISSTFQWVDQTEINLDFGPWGIMTSNEGSDDAQLEDMTSQIKQLFIDSLYLVTKYEGAEFAELNWDGGFGIPTGRNPDPLTFNFMKAMLDQGILSPENAEISFYTDRDSQTGFIQIGSFPPESSIVDLASETILPSVNHEGIPGLEYIWTTPMDSMDVGPDSITFNPDGGNQTYFCLDTGASQLKGDPQAMVEAFNLITNQINMGNPGPDLLFRFTILGSQVDLILTENEYMSLVEAGEDSGQTIVDIVPLAGLPQLALIGSLILDHLYTRYIYTPVLSNGEWNAISSEVRIYNKTNGPTIINNVS